VSLGTLWDRVRQKDTRPLLRTDNPRQTLSDIFDARVPVYAQAGIHAAIADDASIEQTTAMVIKILSQHPDLLEKSS
jgi:shikimate kinase